MKVFKNKKFLGPNFEVGEQVRSTAESGKDGWFTLSVERKAKGEVWSVSLDSEEVETIIRKVERIDEMTYGELTREVDRRIDGLKRESQKKQSTGNESSAREMRLKA